MQSRKAEGGKWGICLESTHPVISSYMSFPAKPSFISLLWGVAYLFEALLVFPTPRSAFMLYQLGNLTSCFCSDRSLLPKAHHPIVCGPAIIIAMIVGVGVTMLKVTFPFLFVIHFLIFTGVWACMSVLASRGLKVTSSVFLNCSLFIESGSLNLDSSCSV